MAETNPKALKKRAFYILSFALGFTLIGFGLMMFLDEPWMESSTSHRRSNEFIERGMQATYDWISNSLGPQVGGMTLMVLGVLFAVILFRSAWKIKT